MRGFGITRTILIGLLAVLPTAGMALAQPKTVQLGMSKTFFTDRSKGTIDVATDDFKEVLKETTNLEGDLHSQLGPMEIADKLSAKQLDFGVFHAHEFAWVQKKYPDLVPLLIAEDKRRLDHAFIVVHKNNGAKSIADLRGKKLDIPMGTKEYSRVFIQKNSADEKGPEGFFSMIAKSSSQAEALDNVARQKVDAAVVDEGSLDFYKEVKGPVFENNLRILQKSEGFPASVIAYKKGGIDEMTLTQFRDGLLKAHKNAKGKDMMKTWNVNAFEAVPKDYAASLVEVLKAYPPPMAQK
jgi:ABC-type phosphate/phosphonate transport system substrate-binding protein